VATSTARRGTSKELTISVASTISQIKAELANRGSRGIIGLSRKFRSMDDDGSKTLSFAEFKKALTEMRFALSERELRDLFSHFDADDSGSISFEEFVQGLRDPLSDRRKRLVLLAFRRIDKDGNGVVEPAELVGTYNASRHPEVLAGRMTEEQVLSEFLETFDVGGEVDGKVTEEEFLNYYTNIGASIDNEDYFELMMRNAWHLSGGEGWCANTANRRVLVTHKDGSQTVEEIKDDLGVTSKEQMKARLQQQGIDVASISKFDGGDDGVDASDKRGSQRASTSLSALARQRGVRGKRSSGAAGVQVKDRSLMSHGSSGAGTSMKDVLNQRHDARPGSSAHQSSGKGDAVKPPEIQHLLAKLRECLKKKGAHGIHGLSRKFRIMDDDGSRSLSFAEFQKGMIELQMELTNRELNTLFTHFDQDRSGEISFDEFMHNGVAPPMTTRRLGLVKQAFRVLDEDRSGIIEGHEIASKYDASKHPDVIAGKKSADEILQEFLGNFEVGGEVDGKVTEDEFIAYYQRLSASIDHEDYFELMIRNAWHLSGGEGWCANTSNLRVLVTLADGRQTVEEVQNDLGLDKTNKREIIRRLRQQGIQAMNVDTMGSTDEDSSHRTFDTVRENMPAGMKHGMLHNDKYHDTRAPRRGRINPALHSQISFGGNEPASATSGSAPSSKSSSGSMTGKRDLRHSSLGAGMIENPDVESLKHGAPQPRARSQSLASFSKTRGNVSGILERLREQLALRGTRGIVGLGRKFKIMDDDGSGNLDYDEFAKGVRESNVHLTGEEMQLLFSYFDTGRDGLVSYDELLAGIRGPMNARRQALVAQAFKVLDKTGDGTIDADDIVNTFDASRHPDVLNGKKTPNDIFHEFLDTFEVGGVKDGCVTQEEFKNYYENVSASIDNDDYFELMIRNSWHISGGEGWSANTSNRRVLATNSDGSQRVVEIKNDLGVAADDTDEMMRRLRLQGESGLTSLKTYGFDDSTQPARRQRGKAQAFMSPNYKTTFSLAHN